MTYEPQREINEQEKDLYQRLSQLQNTMVELRMTRQQFMALFQLVLERVQAEKIDGPVREWIDVATGSTVTIEDLLSLLSIRI